MRHACPKCGTSTLTPGRCTACARPENQRKNKRSTAQVYQSPRWRELRTTILRRDGHTCQLCGARATIAGHIHPFTSPTDHHAWDPHNLRAECPRCSSREANTRRHPVPLQA